MKQLGTIVAIIAAMFLSAIWSGWVLTALWGWFIVPLFGLPALSLAYAIGLSLVVGYLTQQITLPSKDYTPAELLKTTARYITIKPLSFLVTGFVVTLFI